MGDEPKKVVSFALDPEEKERITGVIEIRRKTSTGDRELKFSQWMREAVIEKLKREEENAIEAGERKAAEDPATYSAPKKKPGRGKKNSPPENKRLTAATILAAKAKLAAAAAGKDACTPPR